MNVVNAVFPPAEQAAAFFGAAEDGPFVMVNLLKFKEHADYPDGSDAGLSGREAYPATARAFRRASPRSAARRYMPARSPSLCWARRTSFGTWSRSPNIRRARR